jgi:hypothetical protein
MTVPSLELARPDGILNDAPCPLPSWLPALPLPATVLTAPVKTMTLRTLWLRLSAT